MLFDHYDKSQGYSGSDSDDDSLAPLYNDLSQEHEGNRANHGVIPYEQDDFPVITLPDYDVYKRELDEAKRKHDLAMRALRECMNITKNSRLKIAISNAANSSLMVCARDYPVGDETNCRVKFKKEYLVGRPFAFFKYGQLVNDLLLDEVILSKRCTPVHFDIEIKQKKELHPYFLENSICILQKHVSSLSLESNERQIKCCIKAYNKIVMEPWNEDECKSGLRILCEHIKREMQCIVPQRGNDRIREQHTNMSILSRCRPEKFSFHIILKQIFCESNILSMPLVTFDVARKFVVHNTERVLNLIANDVDNIENDVYDFNSDTRF